MRILRIGLLVTAAALVMAGTPVAATAAASASAPGELRTSTLTQWASAAKATSAYGSDSWAAHQATGAPNVTVCGDYSDAWASSSSTGYDKLTVGFRKAVVPSMVKIYQSYNPGQVTMVQVIDVNGNSTVIYKKAPKKISTCPYEMVISVSGVTAPVKKVRITVNQSVLKLGWTEIDAVQLVGKG